VTSTSSNHFVVVKFSSTPFENCHAHSHSVHYQYPAMRIEVNAYLIDARPTSTVHRRGVVGRYHVTIVTSKVMSRITKFEENVDNKASPRPTVVICKSSSVQHNNKIFTNTCIHTYLFCSKNDTKDKSNEQAIRSKTHRAQGALNDTMIILVPNGGDWGQLPPPPHRLRNDDLLQ